MSENHTYIGRIPGMTRYSPDYEAIAEWAGGEENVSIMHDRGRQYVLDLAEEYPTEACINRSYKCNHVAYGPMVRLPQQCPKCNGG